MVTFDWRRCPAPSMDPPASRPPDTGLPRDDYENGVLTDQGPMVNYGPLSSDMGPRFTSAYQNGEFCEVGLGGGGEGFGFWGLIATGALAYVVMGKK